MNMTTLNVYGKNACFVVEEAIRHALYNSNSSLYHLNPMKVAMNADGAVVVIPGEPTFHDPDRDMKDLVVEALEYFSYQCSQNPLSTYAEEAVDCVRAAILDEPLDRFDDNIVEKYIQKPYNSIQSETIAMLRDLMIQNRKDYEAKIHDINIWQMQMSADLERDVKNKRAEANAAYLKTENELMDKLNKIEESK
jgi:hypothetical protein